MRVTRKGGAVETLAENIRRRSHDGDARVVTIRNRSRA